MVRILALTLTAVLLLAAVDFYVPVRVGVHTVGGNCFDSTAIMGQEDAGRKPGGAK